MLPVCGGELESSLVREICDRSKGLKRSRPRLGPGGRCRDGVGGGTSGGGSGGCCVGDEEEKEEAQGKEKEQGEEEEVGPDGREARGARSPIDRRDRF